MLANPYKYVSNHGIYCKLSLIADYLTKQLVLARHYPFYPRLLVIQKILASKPTLVWPCKANTYFLHFF